MENGNCVATFVSTLVAIGVFVLCLKIAALVFAWLVYEAFGVECQNTWALAGLIAFLLWVESCRG